MNLEMFGMDQFCQDLEEVINPKIFESGKFSKYGLFSQQIFGPVKSYCCSCNRITYKGRSTTETKCPKCEVDITTSDERRKRFGKITLPFPILNPIFYYIMCSAKTTLRNIILDILLYNESFYFNSENLLTKLPNVNDHAPDGLEKLVGLKGALTLIEKIIETNDEKPEFQFIRDNFNKATIQNVLVIPPDFRPCGNNTSGVRIMDEINSLYSILIVRSNQVKQIPFTIQETDDIFRTNFKHIQNTVLKLFEYVLNKLSKKKGLIRANILGKRVDFSGRAAISPDPTLKLDECRIPYWMILEILKPQLVSYLVNRRVCKRYNQAVKLIEDCIKTRSSELLDIVSEFCQDKLCILNRQPSLHRLSVLAFKVTIHLGNTIQIHPMVCHPFNSDFDGDCICGRVNIIYKGQTINYNIRDLKNLELFSKYKTKYRNDGVIVTKYKPTNPNIFIEAIDMNNGNTSQKHILDYSVHENIEMYKIKDSQNRFKDFHVSSDHSMVIYDEIDEEIKRITPKELLQNPEGKYLIQKES